jgi:histidine triad (HIT) family protein
MEGCVFCKIIAGEIPANIVYEDDHVIAFEDIHPKAPVHMLIVPRVHIPTLNDMNDAPEGLEASIMRAAREIARARGVAETGYRLVANTGREGGQEVFHLHFHVMGGRLLGPMC